ncbi:MAG: DegT/DnrJ/EryC1/StrS family aminotransferase [Candidatus Goldbacteria bacterium]|nr:DegT/DnrJ/EryC1/StrS family aminotransferase [Candidatus Goldiibacteriota bacterium]
MIPISKPQIGEEEIQAVTEVLKSGIIASGPKVREFEKEFAEYLGVKNAIAVANGTCAIHAALFGAGIKKGDKVITTPFTFIATANSILHIGAEPVFVDIDPVSYNISPDKIEEALKLDKDKKIKAILLVHLYGLCCDMDKILNIAEKYGVKIIEDAAQGHGAKYKDKMAGTFGDVATFSMYATKNMTTGEGGMVVTDNDSVASEIRKFINHGSEKQYYHTILGYNYRTTDIEAAIGLTQLKKLDGFNKKRRENAEYLKNKLSKFRWIILPQCDDKYFHIYHQFTIRVLNGLRDDLEKYLTESKIGSKIFYPIPLHKQPLYEKIFPNITLPEAEKASNEVLSIPVHPGLSENDLKYITEVFNEFSRRL